MPVYPPHGCAPFPLHATLSCFRPCCGGENWYNDVPTRFRLPRHRCCSHTSSEACPFLLARSGRLLPGGWVCKMGCAELQGLHTGRSASSVCPLCGAGARVRRAGAECLAHLFCLAFHTRWTCAQGTSPRAGIAAVGLCEHAAVRDHVARGLPRAPSVSATPVIYCTRSHR